MGGEQATFVGQSQRVSTRPAEEAQRLKDNHAGKTEAQARPDKVSLRRWAPGPRGPARARLPPALPGGSTYRVLEVSTGRITEGNSGTSPSAEQRGHGRGRVWGANRGGARCQTQVLIPNVRHTSLLGASESGKRGAGSPGPGN